MNKNVVLYASVHHHTTQRVAMQLAKDLQADIHDVLKDPSISIASYDTISLASGIYYGNLHEKIHDHIMKQEWKGKKVIIFYTCGFHYKNYARSAERILQERGAVYAGAVWCRGWDTFGPFKIIKGIARKHPSVSDYERVKNKIVKLMKR